MLVSLIPFIFAANISVNEIDWKYGAEVIYDVKVDTIWNSLESPDHGRIANTTTKLMCRPRSLWILSCRNYKRMATLQDVKKWNESSIMLNMDDFNLIIPSSKPFELYFDYGGLQKIVVPSSFNSNEIDAIRTVVDQLNLYAKINAYEFQRVENSTIGECETHYVVSTPHDTSSEKSDKKEEKRPYEMVIISSVLLSSGVEMPKGYVQKIQRTRHLDTCRHQYGFVFSSWDASIRNDQERPYDNFPSKSFETKFESSISSLSITQCGFASYTEKVLTLNHNKHPTAELTERVTVTLDTIMPAEEPLSSIEDPVTVSIFPERWILD